VIWQAIKILLDIFSLHMRRNGYLGAYGQKSDPTKLPFALATLISSKTGIFPQSDDVCGIYLMFL